MANETIMIVEDDVALNQIMRDYLSKEGFHVVCEFSGKSAILTVKQKPIDLIVLDIMLPQVDGIEVCRNIRLNSHAPIIIISAKSSDYDKILSLGVGADDYLTKPFSLVEFVARVKSHLRRYTSFHNQQGVPEEEQNSMYSYGDLSIDPLGYRVLAHDKEISFTSKEFKLLDYLARHPGIVYTKDQLMDNVWGCSEYIDENTIAVYIGRLREKLSKEEVNYIKTVWGVGYKWER